MEKHEFGIMEEEPVLNKRYDEYEPEKYACVAVPDVYIQALSPYFSDIDCYWHTLDRPEKGLAYYGVTLIPPSSIGKFIEVFSGRTFRVDGLIETMKRAEKENKYMIHFGI